MLQGKIIREGRRRCVQVGPVTVDITDEIEAVLKEERTEHERAIAELRARYADALDRYARIERIVLSGGRGMPSG